MKIWDSAGERGSLMLVVMAFMLIFSFMIGAWLNAAYTNSLHTERKLNHTSTFYLAEAASEHVKKWITEQVEMHASLNGTYYSPTIFSGESLVNLGSYQWLQDIAGSSNQWVLMPGTTNQYYTAKVEVSAGGFMPPQYTIVSWGLMDPDNSLGSTKDDEMLRKVVVKTFLGSFARYAYFTQREDNIWFITNDVLLGPVHTNSLDDDWDPGDPPDFSRSSSFHFAGKPDYWGEVTTTSDRWWFYNGGNVFNTAEPDNAPLDVPNFRDGYDLNAAYVPYPTNTEQIEQAAEGPQGLVIDHDTEITLSVGVGDIGIIEYTEEEEQTVPAWDEEVWHDGHWEQVPCGVCWRCTHGYAQFCRNKHWEWVEGYWETVHHPEETVIVTVTKQEEVYDENNNPDGVAVVHVEGEADLGGTLSGQLTILTDDDLTIVQDVVYNVNPVDYDGDGLLSDANNNGVNDPAADRTDDGDTNDPGEQGDDTDDDGDGEPDAAAYGQPSSNDRLGLVSKANVIVADDHGPAINREIDAAIMALGLAPGATGKFTVEDYSGHLEDTLTIVGSLVQVKRGAVGTFSGSIYGDLHITSGFAKNYVYDIRLLYYPPPYFLPTNLLELIYWQEVPYWSGD